MENSKSIKKTPKRENDYFVRITVIQFLVCGFMVLLVLGVCRMSPDGGASLKAKYNEIMLTDISFSQVWSSVKEVAEYVMKPVDVDNVQKSTVEESQIEPEEKTEVVEPPETYQPETTSDGDIAAVMSMFGDSGKITPPAHGRITSDFGDREDPISGDDGMHNAIDIALDEGSCVAAAWDGVVTKTGYDEKAGNYIWLVHKNGNETFYCHLSEILVSKGVVIRSGETIAFSGNTGYSTGPHLHFAIKKNGSYVDPFDYLDPENGRI